MNIKMYVLLNTFGSVFYCACQWLITIIVVRISSYENAGYLSLAMTTSSSFSAIALFSMRNFQVSDIKEEYTSDIYVGSRIITCGAAFVCCFFSVLLTAEKYQILCTMAYMAIRVVEAVVDVMHGIDQKYNRYDYIGISYVLRGISTIAVFPVLLKVTGELSVTLIVIAVLNFLVAIAFDWRKTHAVDGFAVTLYSRKICDLLKKCLPIVVFSFLLSLENLIPKTILQSNYGTDMLGIYSSIASPTLVVQVFASVAFSPFIPIISQSIYSNQIDKYKNMMHKLYLIFIGMGIIVSLGAALLGRPVLQMLLGKDILQYYSIFMPIVWCTILTGIVWILSAVVVALRRIKSLLVGIIVDFFLCVALAPVFIRNMGMNGVSIVQIIALALYIVFMIIVCETMTNGGQQVQST